jgi:hypothetical protein
MSSAELEEMGVAITIDKSVLDGINEVVELGKEAKDWYREINQKIYEAFPDERDGTLFLIILAIFAAGASLTQNFKIAARVFHGLKSDLEDPQKKAELEEVAEKYKNDPKVITKHLQHFYHLIMFPIQRVISVICVELYRYTSQKDTIYQNKTQ